MKVKSLLYIILFSIGIITSCTDRNNNGNPDQRDSNDPNDDNYGIITNDSGSQGSENYPGNSKGSDEDMRFGANPEIYSDSTSHDSTNKK